ncbi:bile acid:sodium symporter family protein [Methylocapsa sp. S129]|uniref:bile acid:sodium symporter family protein n=1 Tax=Methylocapsa sp. S129 TaxID=1641869 RepID=UPI001FEF548E|nr:bile acid:sodium symporter family protein [Methylocapsa sp. S129]
MLRSLAAFRPDNFTLAIVATVVVASLLPAVGSAAAAVHILTIFAIALLFFLHGARLSREAALAGALHWRLHLIVLAATFVLFPLLGLGLRHALGGVLPESLLVGLLFLCLLPSTVQSSIAFTSIAHGNVAAAVCSASLSNFVGIFLTPALVALLMNLKGGVSLDAVGAIILQLLLPFLAGHFLRPWIGAFVARHRAALGFVDRGSILLVVYLAFSEAVANGLWHVLGAGDLIKLLIVCAVLLAIVLLATVIVARRLGFNRADEIVIVFCGSKKSLASGVPMAGVLFPLAQVGMIVLPLMLFHQIQLMVCAALARRYATSDPVRSTDAQAAGAD